MYGTFLLASRCHSQLKGTTAPGQQFMHLIPELDHAGGPIGPDRSHNTLLVQQYTLRVGSPSLCSHVAVTGSAEYSIHASIKALHPPVSGGEKTSRISASKLLESFTHSPFSMLLTGTHPQRRQREGRIKQRRSCRTPHCFYNLFPCRSCSEDSATAAAGCAAATWLRAPRMPAHMTACAATASPSAHVPAPGRLTTDY